MGADTEPRDVLGLIAVVVKPLLRVAVRKRGTNATLAAWRLEIGCAKGAGTIVLVEVTPQESWYRGEGVFLGWSQERMAEAYQTLTQPPGGSEPGMEFQQLG